MKDPRVVGCVREGMAADLIIYDLDKLTVEEPEILHATTSHWPSAPAATDGMVNGVVTFEDGKNPKAYSGQLIRC